MSENAEYHGARESQGMLQAKINLLRDKLAGNDASTDHKVWNTPGNFLGWSEGGDATDRPPVCGAQSGPQRIVT